MDVMAEANEIYLNAFWILQREKKCSVQKMR